MNSTLRYIEDSLRGSVPNEEIRDTALWIMEESTGLSRTEILCKDTTNIPNLEIIIKRVCSGEPIQYVFGRTKWGGLDLNLSQKTLIPRPETWELIETVVSTLGEKKSLRILDVGTGSGCIAIAIKKQMPDWQVEACDISPEALEIARQNARTNDAEIRFFQCDILSEEIESYDVIVSNPPYVTESEKTGMTNRVLDFEPPTALFVSDENPLLFYRRIAEIRKANYLFFEINERFGKEIADMLTELGYINIVVKKDIFGKDRILSAQLSV